MNTAEREAAYESYAEPRPNHVLRAVMMSRNELFHRWIEKRLQGCWGVVDEAFAANFIRQYCCIKSRAELATNREAQCKFEALREEFRRADAECKIARETDECH